MSIFDSILGQLGGAGGAPIDIANLAAKVGISPDQAESAVSALAVAHPQEGETVETAAATTGIDPAVLQQIVGHIGGEGSLGQFATMIEGNPQAMEMAAGLLNKIPGASGLLGMASGFFGKKD
jgi:DNA-binding IscR family transcriptional regulator